MNQFDPLKPPSLPAERRNPGAWLLLGICGSGMRSFAEMLLDAGETVIGSDVDDAALSDLRSARGAGLKLFPWNQCMDWKSAGELTVVHSLAVSSLFPAVIAAHERGFPVMTLPQALAMFLRDIRQICVAGTHGKTTTAGMIWWILNESGRSPAGFIGGEFCGIPKSGAFGDGRTAVIESCEYRHSFLSLNPHVMVVTGIESDHFDCFKSETDADAAFQRFAEKASDDGLLILNAASARAVQAAKSARCPVVRFGQTDSTSWSARPIMVESRGNTPEQGFRSGGQSFELLYCGTRMAEVTLRVPGLHNVNNAIAALLAAQAEGVSLEQAASSLATFPGMRRRFEYRGRWRGADLIDDYAHHPTAISATLETARTVFPGRRIIAVFEPHQVSRIENLFSDFVRELSTAAECLVLPVLAARESASPADCRHLSGQLVRGISEAGSAAFLLTNLDQVLEKLDDSVQTGDVIITMGAGRTHQIHDEIYRRLQRNSAA